MAAAIHQLRRDEARAHELATSASGRPAESPWKMTGRVARLHRGEV
jgi:hypothetical protein